MTPFARRLRLRGRRRPRRSVLAFAIPALLQGLLCPPARASAERSDASASSHCAGMIDSTRTDTNRAAPAPLRAPLDDLDACAFHCATAAQALACPHAAVAAPVPFATGLAPAALLALPGAGPRPGLCLARGSPPARTRLLLDSVLRL